MAISYLKFLEIEACSYRLQGSAMLTVDKSTGKVELQKPLVGNLEGAEVDGFILSEDTTPPAVHLRGGHHERTSEGAEVDFIGYVEREDLPKARIWIATVNKSFLQSIATYAHPLRSITNAKVELPTKYAERAQRLVELAENADVDADPNVLLQNASQCPFLDNGAIVNLTTRLCRAEKGSELADKLADAILLRTCIHDITNALRDRKMKKEERRRVREVGTNLLGIINIIEQNT